MQSGPSIVSETCRSVTMARLVVAFCLASTAVAIRSARKAKSNSSACKPVTTQENFDLTSFISEKWYAQRQMENRNQAVDGNNCVTAQYTLNNDLSWRYTVAVRNEGVKDNGEVFGADLCAFQPNAATPAKLRVAPCFIPSLFAGNFWVLAYSEEEGYAIISGGQPDQETGNGCRAGPGAWIFTRKPVIDAALLDKLTGMAADQGLDVNIMNRVRQEGCIY